MSRVCVVVVVLGRPTPFLKDGGTPKFHRSGTGSYAECPVRSHETGVPVFTGPWGCFPGYDQIAVLPFFGAGDVGTGGVGTSVRSRRRVVCRPMCDVWSDWGSLKNSLLSSGKVTLRVALLSSGTGFGLLGERRGLCVPCVHDSRGGLRRDAQLGEWERRVLEYSRRTEVSGQLNLSRPFTGGCETPYPSSRCTPE